MRSELDNRYQESPEERELDRLFVESEAARSAGLRFYPVAPKREPVATIEEEFLTFKFLYENDLSLNGLKAVSWSQNQAQLNDRHNPLIREYIVKQLEGEKREEFGRCTKCKEHTAVGDICCGNRPVETD